MKGRIGVEANAMVYLLGLAVLLYLIIWYFYRGAPSSVSTSAPSFGAWTTQYSASDLSGRAGAARVFLIQTLAVAVEQGAIDEQLQQDLLKALELGAVKPHQVVEEWMECALPHLFDLLGHQAVFQYSTQQVGLLMLVAVSGVNPQGDVKRFLSRVS